METFVCITDRQGPDTTTTITKYTHEEYATLKATAAHKLGRQLYDTNGRLPYGKVDFNVVRHDLRLQIYEGRFATWRYNMYFPFIQYEGALPFKVYLEKSWEY